MINKKSLEAVDSAGFSTHFCPPLYSSYCFSQIPATIERLLGVGDAGLPSDVFGDKPLPVDHVVLLFLDGFGWRFFEEFKSKIPQLANLEKTGVVSKLTSMFPSTTAAHVTCIHTDLPPAASGIYEWFMLEPSLNEVIAPLLFSFAGDHQVGSLTKTDLLPTDLYPTTTLYHRLREKGVKATAVQPKAIASSPYSNTVLDGAEVIGYGKAAEGLESVLKSLQKKSYTYFYFSDIDSIGHRKGVHSPEFFQAIEKVFVEIETFASKLPENTALMVTADHGMVEVDPKTTYYLNEHIPNMDKYFLTSQKGRPLTPAGSCRDFFLHVRDESLNELAEILSIFLEGKAEVYLTKELIERGFFGPQRCTEKFLSRVGNLVILPYRGEAVWWHERHRFEQNFFGAHGGLTREEMEIPFYFSCR